MTDPSKPHDSPSNAAPDADGKPVAADETPDAPRSQGGAAAEREEDDATATVGATNEPPPAEASAPEGGAGADEAAGETSRAGTAEAWRAAPAAIAPPPSPPRDVRIVVALVALVVGLAVVLGAYAAANGVAWQARAEAKRYDPAQMQVRRGQATMQEGRLTARAPDQDVLIVSLATDFRARELPLVDWEIAGLPPGANAQLLFNSDYTPQRVHRRTLAVEGGRALPLSLASDPDWLGRITGLALAVRAPGATIEVRGLAVKPTSARQLLTDRAREWFAFEGWTGTSINAVVGGAPAQSLPMPLPVALAVVIGAALLALLHRFAPRRWPTGIVAGASLVFVLGWALLDLRWSANLARQVVATAERFGGKSADERRLASEDAELAAFAQRAVEAMPAEPRRVFVLAQAHYFRGRAGWHLLPHRAWWQPASDEAPPPSLQAGDYVFVWQRPGVQFDAARGRVRFDNGVERPAKMIATGRGAALIEIL